MSLLRKVFILLALPVLYTAFSSVSSCKPEKAKLCNVTFYVYEPSQSDTTVLPKMFVFLLSSNYTDLCPAAVPNPFVSSCYAYKKCYSWQNDIDSSTFRLTFDKDIVSGADTLKAGTDILHDPVFARYAPVKGRGLECSGLYYSIGKNDSTVMQQLVFKDGAYMAHFTGRTTDGLQLDKIHYVVFRR